MSQKLSSQPPANWTAGPSNAQTIIHVDSTLTFQSILGLGSSLERSTCYNISRLPSDQQEKVIESLVDAEKGIGMSLMRICIGTPDFTASPWYSYDDLPPRRSRSRAETFLHRQGPSVRKRFGHWAWQSLSPYALTVKSYLYPTAKCHGQSALSPFVWPL